MGNGSDLHSNLKMSSAEKVALDGIFKSLQVNKKPVVKEDKEETITLSRKQLNALIGTINEVCELVANEPLESFKSESLSFIWKSFSSSAEGASKNLGATSGIVRSVFSEYQTWLVCHWN